MSLFVDVAIMMAAAGLSAALMQVKAEVSAPNDESDSTIVVEGPPAAPIETIDLAEGSSDSGSDHEAARAREARRLRRRHRRPTNTDAATNRVVDRSERSSRPVHARTVETASCSIAIKQEADGGWPAEFQSLRALEFDRAEYDRLHELFFAEYSVYAGARESRTRGGTLRVTQRVTGTTVKIAEWPRLRTEVEQLHGGGEFSAALAHLRCLEHYMQIVHHHSIPRIMREGSSGAGGVEETIDLAGSSSDEEATAQFVDVEQLEELLLGPLPRTIKQELTQQEERTPQEERAPQEERSEIGQTNV